MAKGPMKRDGQAFIKLCYCFMCLGVLAHIYHMNTVFEEARMGCWVPSN